MFRLHKVSKFSSANICTDAIEKKQKKTKEAKELEARRGAICHNAGKCFLCTVMISLLSFPCVTQWKAGGRKLQSRSQKHTKKKIKGKQHTPRCACCNTILGKEQDILLAPKVVLLGRA